MEEITNLMEEAKTAIINLENFIFTNKKEKYINLKTVTSYMESQIEEADITIDLHIEDRYESIKTRLNAITSKCNEIIETFQARNNVAVAINENGEVVIQNINYESKETPIENNVEVGETPTTPEIHDVNEQIPQINPFGGIEIIGEPRDITAEERQAFPPAPEIVDPSIAEAVPNINIINQQPTVIDDQANYSKDLDVAAVDAFLGNNADQNILKL